MGKIGIPRREFLYDLQWWEINSIIRGYSQRHILKYQLLRMNIWASMFCMGNPDKKLPEDLFKLYFDDDIKDDTPPISEEDQQRLLDEMAKINADLQKGKTPW
ncbi:MAG: hypothetical protein IKA00_09430 [Prevotella sp.]|nr:hypothetical protein [Prevotella sp.]